MKPKSRRHQPCPLHPDHPHSSLCATCLRERLSLLNPSPFPDLRRSRTFSGNRGVNLGLNRDPGRRSCDVLPRSTLEDLFTVNEEAGCISAKCDLESKDLGFLGDTSPVPELREVDDGTDCAADSISPNSSANAGAIEEFEDSRPIKELIDLEFKTDITPFRRDFKDIAGSFWVAASVFSKKLHKWKRNQKNGARPDYDRHRGGARGLGEMRLEILRGSRLQSEVGECGFGRRSCDSDPRVSIDLGRASIDGGGYSADHVIRRKIHDPHPRCSLDIARASVDCGTLFVDDENEKQGSIDAPRASCDGYLNRRTIPARATPMVSVIENAMATVYGFERLNEPNKDPKSFGGIKRSNSNTKLIITEEELMGSKTRFSKDDSSDSSTIGTTSKDTTTSSASSSSTSRNEIRDPRKWGKLSKIRDLFSRRKQPKSNEDPIRKIEGDSDMEEGNSDRKWKLVRSSSVASSRSLCTMPQGAGAAYCSSLSRF